MGYVPPDPPKPKIGELYGIGVLKPEIVRNGIVYSDRDCEYCGTLIELGIGSRCPSCGAPYRRRPVRPLPFPKNRIVTE